MPEILPPSTLLNKNSEQTTEMCVKAWRNQGHVEPIMRRMFAAAAQRAIDIRVPLIEDIESTGIDKYYYQFATLSDGRTISLRQLLEFPLYQADLPIEQAGIPDNQRLSREHTVSLRVGGPQLGYGTDDSLDISRYSFSGDGQYDGKRAYGLVARKDATPESVKIIERIETKLEPVDGEYDSSINSSVQSVDEYLLKINSWTPNLSRLGRPDITLPRQTRPTFHYLDASTGERGSLGAYNEKTNVADSGRRLSRMAELATMLLNLESFVDDENGAYQLESKRIIPELEQ